MKEAQSGLKESFDKFHIDVESKIEVMRTNTHTEFNGLKNTMIDVPNFEKTQEMIKDAINKIKFPEPPKTEKVYA